MAAICTAIWGRRGSGKTTLTKKLLGKHPRVIVFDPMAEYANHGGFKRAETLREVVRLLKAGWSTGFKIAYVPSGDFPRMLHGLATVIRAAQSPFQAGADSRELLLVVEEMNLSYPSTKLRADWSGMSVLTLQGRHYGVGIIAISQRPANVSADFRGMVEKTYVMALSTAIDRKAVTAIHGNQFDGALRALKNHNYLLFRDGEVSAGNTRRRRAA